MTKQEFKSFVDKCIMNHDLPTDETFYNKLDLVIQDAISKHEKRKWYMKYSHVLKPMKP
jgi:hypothetical protein